MMLTQSAVIPSVARDLEGWAARHPRPQIPRYARDDERMKP
jgi:hypothetical protein